MQDETLDSEQVAQLLKVNERTIKRLAEKHELPGFRVGRQWRFRREAIDDYIRRQEQPEEEK